MDFSPIQKNAAFKEFFEEANDSLFCFINPFAWRSHPSEKRTGI